MIVRLARSLTPHRVADELSWRWQSADGDMGIRSNFGAMVTMLTMGGPSGGRPIMDIDDHCIASAAKVRHIDRALARVPKGERALLRALFASPEGDSEVLLGLLRSARVLRDLPSASTTLTERFDALARCVRYSTAAEQTVRVILSEARASATTASRLYSLCRGFRLPPDRLITSTRFRR